jgi:hypothetical protein
VSRRSKRSGERPAAQRAEAAAPAQRETSAGERAARLGPAAPRLLAQVGILAAVFAATVLIAELAGAANLGVSLGIGQVAFAIVLMVMLIRY